MPSSPTKPIKLAGTSSPSTVDGVEAKKAAVLEHKIAGLESQIEAIKVQLEQASSNLKSPDPDGTVQNHIRLLRDYNDIRDIGTGLMGIIANDRRVPMKRVYDDFQIGEKD
ncbi:MAG: hypothetical protein Q9220_004516 [cf. Caloplaca sp. 1 TL-2023]